MNNEIRKANFKEVRDLSKYSEQEIEKYDRITSGLNTKDPNTVLGYGSEIREVAEQAADQVLNSTKRSSAGDVGQSLGDLLNKLGDIKLEDPDNSSPFRRALCKYIPFLRPVLDNYNKFISRYDSITETFDKIKDDIEVIKRETVEGNNTLVIMYDNTLKYREQVRELIEAGNYKISKIDEELSGMDKSDPERQQILVFKDSLERDIQNKILLYYSLENTMGAITIMSGDNQLVCQKAERLLAAVIPNMKHQASVYIRARKLVHYADVFQGIEDTSDTLMKSASQTIHDVSIKLANQSRETDIKAETLIETMRKTTETVDEIRRIMCENSEKTKNNIKLLEQESIKMKESLGKTMVVTDKNLFERTVVAKELK